MLPLIELRKVISHSSDSHAVGCMMAQNELHPPQPKLVESARTLKFFYCSLWTSRVLLASEGCREMPSGSEGFSSVREICSFRCIVHSMYHILQYTIYVCMSVIVCVHYKISALCLGLEARVLRLPSKSHRTCHFKRFGKGSKEWRGVGVYDLRMGSSHPAQSSPNRDLASWCLCLSRLRSCITSGLNTKPEARNAS